MTKLKHICLTLLLLIKQACLLPQSIANAAKQKWRRMAVNEHETERLDRIRDPSKYEGK
jgi:hypothetical protein